MRMRARCSQAARRAQNVLLLVFCNMSCGCGCGVTAETQDPDALCFVYKDPAESKHVLILELLLVHEEWRVFRNGSAETSGNAFEGMLADVQAQQRSVNADLQALEAHVEELQRKIIGKRKEAKELSDRAERLTRILANNAMITGVSQGAQSWRTNREEEDERAFRIHIFHQNEILISAVQSVKDAGVRHGLYGFSDQVVRRLGVALTRMDGLSHVSKHASCVFQDDFVTGTAASHSSESLSRPSVEMELLGPMGLPLDNTIVPTVLPLEVSFPNTSLAGSERIMFSVNGALINYIPVRRRDTFANGDMWPASLLDLCRDPTCIVADWGPPGRHW